MEDTTKTQIPVGEPTPPAKKPWLKWVVAAALAGLAFFYFFGNKETGRQGSEPKKAVYHRDEPGQDQVLQSDYKEKILEMLDSGMSVNAISKETGIRRDVIRKLKKEHNK